MSIEWCRLWHDMVTDPKFRAVAKRCRRPTGEVVAVFVAMLTNASANEDERGTLRNWNHEDIGVALDFDAEVVESIYLAMQGKLLVGNRLTGWERRQPKREDNSTDRVRAHRERKRDVTQCNAEKRAETIDPDPEGLEDNTSPLEQEAAREGQEVIKFDSEGFGFGGVPRDVGAATKIAVAAEQGLSDVEPLVRRFKLWKPRKPPRDVDALFRKWAKTHLKNNPGTRAECRPLAELEREAIAPKSFAKPSPGLLKTRLMRGSHVR